MPLLAATIILCERFLQEADGILSAIRIADGFVYTPSTDPNQTNQTIEFSVIALLKFDASDVAEHSTVFRIVRPDGETKDIDSPVSVDMSTLPPSGLNTVRGANVLINLRLVIKGTGIHYLKLVLDGQEVATAIFTLSQNPEAEHSQPARALSAL